MQTTIIRFSYSDTCTIIAFVHSTMAALDAAKQQAIAALNSLGHFVVAREEEELTASDADFVVELA